jgi:hypothetical protein
VSNKNSADAVGGHIRADNHPGSNDRWVIAKDKLSLSLLRARLIDLKMPIKIVQGA